LRPTCAATTAGSGVSMTSMLPPPTSMMRMASAMVDGVADVAVEVAIGTLA